MTPIFPEGMTRSQIKKFYREFAKEAGIHFISRGVVSWLLKMLGKKIPEPGAEILERLDEALRPCAVGDWVFLDHCIGDSTPWLRQILVAVHEVCHCYRERTYVDDGGTVTGWYRDYFHVRQRGACAVEEAVASSAESQVHYYLTGAYLPQPDLSGYWLTSDAAAVARETYQRIQEQARPLGRGGATLDASEIAIRCLRRVRSS